MTKHLDIYFLRHTEPLIDAGICYGQLDCDVNEDYAEQLLKIKKFFQTKSIDAIYSSPLLRCAKLAEDLAVIKNGLAVRYLASLKEINFGDWEGMKWDDIPRIEIDKWNNNRLHFKFPNGESPREFTQRVLVAYSGLQPTSHSLQRKKTVIVVVAHAGVIRTLLANILALTFDQSLNISLDKPSISCCSFKDNELDCYDINIPLVE
ncbi:alpha-ribazole phosphatase family protein [Psychromonas sp. KJ10-10]|uniref:alpha-ribazole phosphatase family protein n=1 Tax=Psychromonas sp. KJ10-10 TaxID=3391823 RepID=UPI0039B44009